MINNIKILLCRINGNFKSEFISIACIMMVASILEVITIGLILPYLSILIGDPKYLTIIKEYGINIENKGLLKIFATLVFIIVVIFSNVIRIILLRRQTRFGFMFGNMLSIELFRIILSQNYLFHRNNNSANIKSLINEKSQLITNSVILPTLVLVTSAFIATTILSVIIYIDKFVALSALIVFTVSYVGIFKKLKTKLNEYSNIINSEISRVSVILNETFDSVKVIKLYGAENIFANAYNKSDMKLRLAQGDAYLAAAVPKNIVEIIGMISLSITALLITSNNADAVYTFGILGVISMSAQRLLPVLQQCYASWCQIRVANTTLSEVVEALSIYDGEKTSTNKLIIPENPTIHLQNISYSYPDGKLVLDNISLDIKYGEKIGLIGSTGSGKSTFSDILLGLITPEMGSIRIGSAVLNQNSAKDWHNYVRTVSQDFVFIEATIAENIAFGKRLESIDRKRLNEVLTIVQLSDFIQELKGKELHMIKESGANLSGGQKQRIMIARALYKHNTKMIIFDEATSALDTETENLIVQQLNKLNQTLIIISHKYSILSACDRIIKLDKGKLYEIQHHTLK